MSYKYMFFIVIRLFLNYFLYTITSVFIKVNVFVSRFSILIVEELFYSVSHHLPFKKIYGNKDKQ